MNGRKSFPHLLNESETHIEYWKERAAIEMGERTHLQGQHTALKRAFDQQGISLQRAIKASGDQRRELADMRYRRDTDALVLAEVTEARDEYKRRLIRGGLM
jgi:hypothetical protein